MTFTGSNGKVDGRSSGLLTTDVTGDTADVAILSAVPGVPGVSGASDRDDNVEPPCPTNGLIVECHASRDNTDNHQTEVASAEPAKGKTTSSPPDASTEPETPSPPDYPEPAALKDKAPFTWDEKYSPVEHYRELGRRLAAFDGLYRAPGYASGLIFAPEQTSIPVTVIDTAHKLAAIIIDKLRVEIWKEGKLRGHLIPSRHLNLMLASEAFLQEFHPVDEVTDLATYLGDFELTLPGYKDGGVGHRILYHGQPPRIERSHEAISAFLHAMPFAGPADRANSLAFALTVPLARLWPGAKPAFPVTGTKSHSGKDTVIRFATGNYPGVSVSHQVPDWPTEHNICNAIKQTASLRVICLENARSTRSREKIASPFLERFITDPELFLSAPGTGSPIRTPNRFVVAISTNSGSLSEDLLNRSCPIHLAPLGNIEDRESAIGNPKLDYLPRHRDQIEAELRGMIENWKDAGHPLDTSVRHPCIHWAQTIGGILLINGFTGFLGNYSQRRSADDPVRRALGHLGASRPGEWLPSTDWATQCADMGLVNHLIPAADRGSEKGRARGIGIVLTHHVQERLFAETDDKKYRLVLEKARRRFSGDPPSTKYRFKVEEDLELPETPEPATDAGTPGDELD